MSSAAHPVHSAQHHASKLTAGQWDALVKSGGVVDKSIWYPTAGSLKGALACKNFNNPEGIETDEEWNEIRPWLRPVLLNIVKSKRVLLEGVTFKNSPSWCLHPLSCEHITINQVKVFNPWYSQNGDALDLESCKNALIINNIFDAGDDAICIKSGKDEDGRKRGEPCQNVIVKNNTVLHGHGGFVVGSEMSGGVKNIYVTDYKTKKIIDAKTAYYVFGSNIMSVGGDDVIPFALESDAKEFYKEKHGRQIYRFDRMTENFINYLDMR